MKKFLFIRPDALGDAILTLPVIEALRSHVKDAEISWLGKDYLNALFPQLKLIDNFTDSIDRPYDHSLHFVNEPRYAWQAYLKRIPHRVGYGDQWPLALLYNHKVPAPTFWQHQIERNLQFLEPLGINLTTPACRSFSEGRPQPKKYIGFVVAQADRQAKYWTTRGFARLAELIDRELQMKVALFGAEKEPAQKILRIYSKNVADLTGQVPFGRLPEELNKCHLMVSGDTGLMHLSCALKIPVVALFTNKDHKPLRWGPRGSEHLILHNPQVCKKHCVHAKCRDFVCADAITAEEVLSAVKQLLSHKGINNDRAAFYNRARLSMNILTFDADLAQALSRAGLHCFLADRKTDLIRFIIENDINIIQAPPTPRLLWIKFRIENIRGEKMLIYKGPPPRGSLEEIIDHYAGNKS